MVNPALVASLGWVPPPRALPLWRVMGRGLAFYVFPRPLLEPRALCKPKSILLLGGF